MSCINSLVVLERKQHSIYIYMSIRLFHYSRGQKNQDETAEDATADEESPKKKPRRKKRGRAALNEISWRRSQGREIMEKKV